MTFPCPSGRFVKPSVAVALADCIVAHKANKKQGNEKGAEVYACCLPHSKSVYQCDYCNDAVMPHFNPSITAKARRRLLPHKAFQPQPDNDRRKRNALETMRQV